MTGDDPTGGRRNRRDQYGRHDALNQAVTDPVLMREIVQRRLEPVDGRVWEITECRVGTLRRREGYRYSVQYDLRLRDPVSGIEREQVVTGVSYGPGQTRAIWDQLRSAPAHPSASLDPAPYAPYSYVPALDMLLQVFPHDHRLPALAQLMPAPPPELTSHLLARFGPEEWQLEYWHGEAIRYRIVTRATVKLTVRARHPATGRVAERDFYAKVYRNTEEARQAYATLRALHVAVAAARARFRVVAPVVFVEEWHTVVQTAAPGTPLLRLLRRNARRALPVVRRTARAIADLHGLDLDLSHRAGVTPPRSLRDRLARLKQAGEALRVEHPDLAPEVTNMVRAVLGGLGDVAPAPTHGDLKPDHVLIEGDDVFLIDFDFLHKSDPMLDVVTMMRHLSRVSVDSSPAEKHADLLWQVFIDEYFVNSPPEWQDRLPLYHAMTAITDAARSRHGERPKDPERLAEAIRHVRRMIPDE